MSEREVFTAARELTSPADRAAYLSIVGIQHPALAERVRLLLLAEDTPDSLLDMRVGNRFLHQPGDTAPQSLKTLLQDNNLTQPLPFTGAGSSPDVSFGQVEGYEITEVLGRGGMSVVYKAEQLALKRTVALKMMLTGVHASEDQRARFRIEAEAVARLQHPNIVQIHEVGESGGYPYCALEYVEGGTLAELLGGKPMPIREAAKLVETLARAMQLAHSRNVVHRDLKPANIMMTTDGVPKITDFGLARQLDRDNGATHTGVLMGTPSYMAPEQASGFAHQAGPAADVYALGTILYDCLVGEAPFKGATLTETLDRVRSQEPVPPSQLVSGVPIDLETICLKCLQKEPECRYASALELAEELTRFQNGEPIFARPITRRERITKWVKRNPGLAATTVGLLSTLVGAFALITWSYLRAEEARQGEVTHREAADRARNDAEQREQIERWGRYRANMAVASAELRLQNIDATRRALEDTPPEHRNWEWKHFQNHVEGPAIVMPAELLKINSMALSPSGQHVAVQYYEHNEINIFEIHTGRRLTVLKGHTAPVTSVEYRPDGKQLATVSDDQTLRLWDPTSGKQLMVGQHDLDPRNRDRHLSLVYNSDGTRIVTSPKTINAFVNPSGACRLWDSSTGKLIKELSGWQDGSHQATFSPDGKRVAASSAEFLRIYDAMSGQLRATSTRHVKAVAKIVYSPDGKRIASAHEYTEPPVSAENTSLNSIRLHDGVTGQLIAELRGHSAYIYSLNFSPDGKRLITSGTYPDNTARLWDATTGRLIAVLSGHKNTTYATFNGDGSRVVTNSLDQTARIWDGQTGQILTILSGHTGQLRHVTVSPNGKYYVTASEDSTLRLWYAKTGELALVLRGHRDGFSYSCPPVFTPDGQRLLSGSNDGTVRNWDLQQLEQGGVLRGHKSYVYDVAFSPDGEQVASVAWDGTTRLWNATTGQELRQFPHKSTAVYSVAYTSDGSQLVTHERNLGVCLWRNAPTGPPIEVLRVEHIGEEGTRATIHPSGKMIAAGSKDGSVHLIDVLSKKKFAEFTGHTKCSTDVAFDPAGHLLASGGYDGTVRLWDVSKRSLIASLKGHTDIIWRVAFSSDGKLLASGSSDNTICLWDVETHEKLARIPSGSIVYCVAISPDGRRLAAGCRDNTIRLYDIATRQQVAELHGHTDYVHAVAWSPDSTRLVSGSGDFTVRVWDSLSNEERSRRTAKSSP